MLSGLFAPIAGVRAALSLRMSLDDEGDARIDHLRAVALAVDRLVGRVAARAAVLVLVDDVVVAVEHAQDRGRRHERAAVGEGRVDARQFQQRDVAAAERQRDAVLAGVVAQAFDAEALRDFQQMTARRCAAGFAPPGCYSCWRAPSASAPDRDSVRS